MNVQIIKTVSATDERGFTAVPISNERLKSIYNVHIVSLKPGSVRGNHYHERQTEQICVLGGPCKLVAVDSESDEKMELVFDGESCPLIIVPPRVIHALKNIGEETVYLLCYADRPHDPDRQDTVRSVILE